MHGSQVSQRARPHQISLCYRTVCSHGATVVVEHAFAILWLIVSFVVDAPPADHHVCGARRRVSARRVVDALAVAFAVRVVLCEGGEGSAVGV